MEDAVRITPEQFDTIFKVFVIVILCFFAFAALQMVMMKARWRDEEGRRRQRKPKSPDGRPHESRDDAVLAATFGTSGIGASDVATSAFEPSASSSESSADISTGTGGGDSGGGSDFSGGGGEVGGGGASGSWS